MTIASMDELEALPPGSTVKVTSRRVGDRVFTRTDTGFDSDGTVVEPRFFAGHVAAGQVANFADGAPEPGDHYVLGSHRYVVLSVAGGIVWMMQFRNGLYRDLVSRPLAEARELGWTRVAPEQRPEWHGTAYTLGTVIRSRQGEIEAVRREVAETRTQRDEAILNLTRMRETRAAQIQVVATGVTRLPLEKAAGQVPDRVTVVDVVASWRREFTVTTEPASGCQCGTVSREKVIELLGIEGSSEHADFGFQVDCGRH